jgi:hypothetical protein
MPFTQARSRVRLRVSFFYKMFLVRHFLFLKKFVVMRPSRGVGKEPAINSALCHVDIVINYFCRLWGMTKALYLVNHCRADIVVCTDEKRMTVIYTAKGLCHAAALAHDKSPLPCTSVPCGLCRAY